jgi:hypothetical protein
LNRLSMVPAMKVAAAPARKAPCSPLRLEPRLVSPVIWSRWSACGRYAIDFGARYRPTLAIRSDSNGHPEHRLPNTLNVSFVGRVGAEILERLDGVAASTGSACHSGEVELSPVLKAMGVPPRVGMGAIRFSLGRYTTAADVDAVIGRLEETLLAVAT